MKQTKIFLSENEMPKQWYNILSDLPKPMPPVLHPATHKPIGPDDLAPLFPMEIIKQEVSTERWIDIPEQVRDIYRLWRPSPLFRARRLEKALDTPAKIYFKYEGVSPAGSHKPNTAIAQAYYNKQEGVKRITTETGAGQWGSALSLACNFFDIECKVYMVKVSYDQKPYRKSMIRAWGATIVPSPSPDTNAGRSVLERYPDSPGSLGIAISEAVEDAATRDDTKYSLGSVLNHVLLHQTVIGLEAKKQMEIAGDYPDVIVGCVGGGSNFGGIVLPFIKDKLEGKKLRAIAVEPASCPTLTRGPYAYDFGDEAQMTPMLAMYTLGHDFVPPPIHAGGLRYHGMAPIISHLVREKYVEAVAYKQLEIFQSGVLFSRAEGIIPAPESTHAIHATIVEALKAKEAGVPVTILFNLSGHGHFDMASYDAYFDGKLPDHALPEDEIKKALEVTKNYPQID
ncbi:MAG: TrpB-like pyridoxal phosphate-dependent enzyme [Calditrichaeota bacterium]|nr:TrpB-like pyridoxal phosphate-dependent enzyme [Calditrichota bacterium]